MIALQLMSIFCLGVALLALRHCRLNTPKQVSLFSQKQISTTPYMLRKQAH